MTPLSTILAADSSGPSRLEVLGPIAVPVVLGLVGIYLLLPRARSFPAIWGTLCVSLALLSAGWLLIWGKAMTPEMVLFYCFSGLALISGGLLVTQSNPVHAALAFAMVVLSTCGLFLLQAAPFLMAATLIVYAGAIVVTFLFVIMLAQQSGRSDADHRSREPGLASIAGFVLLGALLYLLHLTYDVHNLNRLIDRTHLLQDRIADWLERAEGDSARISSPEIEADLSKANPDALYYDFGEEARKHEDQLSTQPAAGHITEMTRLQGALTKVQENTDDLKSELKRSAVLLPEGRNKLNELKQSLDLLVKVAAEVRETYGNLQPHGDKADRFSTFSGPRPNEPMQTLHPDGQTAPMSAQNVAGLGRSLFTDFLIPVELGGTLLLVATIGAIAIAGRRAEGLR
jgi:NADH:ubiquinone oxidoreductase subunit 6 (subunit J)